MPAILETALAIESYGAAAVLGSRLITRCEFRQFSAALNIYRAYKGMQASGDYAGWAERNPELYKIISWAQSED